MNHINPQELSILLTVDAPDETMERIWSSLKDPYSETSTSEIDFSGSAYLKTPIGDSRLDATAEIWAIVTDFNRKGGEHSKIYRIGGFISNLSPSKGFEDLLMNLADNLSIGIGMTVDIIFDFSRGVGLISAIDGQPLRLLDDDMPEFKAYEELREPPRPQSMRTSLLNKMVAAPTAPVAPTNSTDPEVPEN